MASGGGKRKLGRNKKSASMVNYKAQGRLERNKKRNMATEERRQLRDLGLREHRGHLRKIGALRRIDRRIAAARDVGHSTTLLERTRANVAAAAGV